MPHSMGIGSRKINEAVVKEASDAVFDQCVGFLFNTVDIHLDENAFIMQGAGCLQVKISVPLRMGHDGTVSCLQKAVQAVDDRVS